MIPKALAAILASCALVGTLAASTAFPDPAVDNKGAETGKQTAVMAGGCFWCVELVFQQIGGVEKVVSGYAGGEAKDAHYEIVSTGRTGHAESVEVTYDPKKISYEKLLKTFWENHDPTQGMRQGNDVGTQYRSGIYAFTPEQKKAAEESKAMYQKELSAKRYGAITTEVIDAPEFYFAEDYHQQYLGKNPGGYCGLGGTGVSCPVGLKVSAA